MKRSVIAVTCLALFLAACATAPAASPTTAPAAAPATAPLVVAGITQNTVDPFWVTLNCGAQAEATRRGVELELFTSTSMDASELTTLFDSAKLANPDGMFLNVANIQQFSTQLQEFAAAGVPVASNAQTDPPAVSAMVWTSADASGFMSELLTLIPEDEGSFGVLGGIAGIAPLEARYQPVVDEIAKARPNLTVLPTEYSMFDVNKATNIVSSWLIAHPDLKVIVASNGPDGIGAAAAIKAKGLADQVTVIAFDAVPPEVEALREGTIKALIAQPAKAIGAAQLGAVVDQLQSGTDGPVPAATETVGIPQKLLTASTIDDPANADYIYVTECS